MDKEKLRLRQISNKYLAQGLKEKNLDSKLVYIDFAIQADKENDEAMYHKAHLFYEKSNYEDANKYYNKALEINPKNGTVYSEKGNTLIKLKKYDEAYNCYDEALKINPKNSDAYYGKEYALIHSKKYDEKIKFYNGVLRINPKNEKTLYKLGYTLYKVGKNKEAIDCYIKLLEICPKNEILGNHENYDYNSFALFKLGKYEEAIKYCDKFLDKNPKNNTVWNYKGNALSNLGRYDGAIECYKKSLEIKPEDENAWYNIGYYLYKLSKYEDTLKYFQKTLEINSKDASAWEYQGNAFLKLGKYWDAIKCYDKYIEINPESFEVLKNRKNAIFLNNELNDRILILTKNKNELIKRVIHNLENSNIVLKNILHFLLSSDSYLVYSDRIGLLSKLEDYETILFDLKQKKDKFEKYFNDLVETSLNELNALRNKIENFNKELIERHMKEYDFLFKKSTFDLDREQKTAIIIDDRHNLVVAGAGSGKTEVLITKIAYLVERKIEPDRILALAFNEKAVSDIKNRLNKRFGIEVKVKTFHSFGNEVLSKPKLRFENEIEFGKFINKLYTKAEEEPSFQDKLRDYMLHFGEEEIKQECEFETKEKWYQYMRGLTYTTLDRTPVKSEAERTIFNFLFTHKINQEDIKFEYEPLSLKMLNYRDKNNEIKILRPDFLMLDYNIIIEHWAIDERGQVPKWFKPGYQENMKLKKEIFKNHKEYSLMETNFGEYKENNFINNFENELIKRIKRKYPDQVLDFTPIGYSELVEKVWENCIDWMKENPKYIATFIKKAKTNGLNPEKILERLETEKWSPKQKAFAVLALVIYRDYENELKQTNQIDFSDMINHAIDELKTNKSLYEKSFDHILIDEYQDISRQRYRLIKALMAKNCNCKLFCVGDDWQSIMGFTGSNLEYFINFQSYFDHPEITYLSRNYRSIQSIVGAGAELIKNNGGQLQKQTIANNRHEMKICVYKYPHNALTYNQQTLEHFVNKVKEYQMNGYSPQDIMILYRARNEKTKGLLDQIIDYAKFNNVSIKKDTQDRSYSPLRTIHTSKGLEAKIVILLCVDKGLYGFPSEIDDPTIFEPAMCVKIVDKEAEERRLFYVAITRSKENVIIYTQKDNESKFLDEIQKYIEIIEF